MDENQELEIIGEEQAGDASSENQELNSIEETSDSSIENQEDIYDGSPKDNKKTVLYEVLDWIKTIAIGVVIGLIVVIFVVERNDVFGSSMQPTLYEGDKVFCEKISTYFDNYDRFDIVVLSTEGIEDKVSGKYLVKRIIGLPGETIRIVDGKVYIKEVGASDFYLLDESSYLPSETSTNVMSYGLEHHYDEITLGLDEYYCMGDNRMVSNDSRNLGPFKDDKIRGIVMMIMYPFSRIGFI